jgi:uncharacterized protein YggL (DUF469 family)
MILAELKPKGAQMSLHDEIVEQFEAYVAENQKFEEKGVKAAAARARKALGELGKLTKERRKEIQEKKNTM